MISRLDKAANSLRQQLLERDTKAAQTMIDYYGQIYKGVQNQVARLTQEIDRAQKLGTPITPNQLLQNTRLHSLLHQVEEEIGYFSKIAEGQVHSLQTDFLGLAEQNTQKLIQDQLKGAPHPTVVGSFNHLPARQVAKMVGYLGDGSPLSSLLGELGEDAASRVKNALVSGVGRGKGPREIAKDVQEGMGMNLTRALTIARTESMRVYRDTALESYQANSDVVYSWVWVAELSSRTCPVCVALNGTVHPLTEPFASHTNCRCTPAPVTKGWEALGFEGLAETQVQVQSGVEWFKKQPESVQREILGRGKFIAFKEGQIALTDLVGWKEDDDWGAQRFERSLRLALYGPQFGAMGKPFPMSPLKAPKAISSTTTVPVTVGTPVKVGTGTWEIQGTHHKYTVKLDNTSATYTVQKDTGQHFLNTKGTPKKFDTTGAYQSHILNHEQSLGPKVVTTVQHVLEPGIDVWDKQGPGVWKGEGAHHTYEITLDSNKGYYYLKVDGTSVKNTKGLDKIFDSQKHIKQYVDDLEKSLGTKTASTTGTGTTPPATSGGLSKLDQLLKDHPIGFPTVLDDKEFLMEGLGGSDGIAGFEKGIIHLNEDYFTDDLKPLNKAILDLKVIGDLPDWFEPKSVLYHEEGHGLYPTSHVTGEYKDPTHVQAVKDYLHGLGSGGLANELGGVAYSPDEILPQIHAMWKSGVTLSPEAEEVLVKVGVLVPPTPVVSPPTSTPTTTWSKLSPSTYKTSHGGLSYTLQKNPSGTWAVLDSSGSMIWSPSGFPHLFGSLDEGKEWFEKEIVAKVVVPPSVTGTATWLKTTGPDGEELHLEGHGYVVKKSSVGAYYKAYDPTGVGMKLPGSTLSAKFASPEEASAFVERQLGLKSAPPPVGPSWTHVPADNKWVLDSHPNHEVSFYAGEYWPGIDGKDVFLAGPGSGYVKFATLDEAKAFTESKALGTVVPLTTTPTPTTATSGVSVHITLPAATPVSDWVGEDPHDHGTPWGPKEPGKVSYGSVLFNEKGEVLLREPLNHYDGYHWTFAKGGQDPGEHPVETALRETLEETGHKGEVIGYLPGAYKSGSSANYYYVMKSGGVDAAVLTPETTQVKWVSPDEAEKLINQSTNVKGKERDLKILQAAKDRIEAWGGPKATPYKGPSTPVFPSVSPGYTPTPSTSPLGDTPPPKAPPLPKQGPRVTVSLPSNLFEYEDVQDFPSDLSSLKFVKALGGSTGAQLMEDANGSQFVMKKGKDAGHLLEETYADQAYRSLGVNVPEFKVYTDSSGRPVKLAKWIEGEDLGKYESTHSTSEVEKVRREIGKHFAVDALFGNWDVVGLSKDNIKVDAQGRVWRIDNGGSFRYRAQGTLKTATQWSKYPTELFSLRDSGVNAQTGATFGHLNIYDINEQMKFVVENRQKLLSSLPLELRPSLGARVQQFADLSRPLTSLKDDKWKVEHAELFSRGQLDIRVAGVTDSFSQKLGTKGMTGVTPKDEHSKEFDNLRGAGSAVVKFSDMLTSKGLDYKNIRDWASAQGSSSSSTHALAIKYHWFNVRDVPEDRFFWHGGIDSAKHEYGNYLAKYGGEEKLKQLWAYQHAFTYETLTQIDLPYQNMHGTEDTINVIRTESSTVLSRYHYSRGVPNDELMMHRGISESYSMFKYIRIQGGEVTTQDVPLVRTTFSYLQEVLPGSGSTPLYGDRENEILVIADGIPAKYWGTEVTPSVTR